MLQRLKMLTNEALSLKVDLQQKTSPTALRTGPPRSVSPILLGGVLASGEEGRMEIND